MVQELEENRIYELLRDCIDFSTAEKAEMLQQFRTLSADKRVQLLGVLQRSAERFTVLLVKYPKSARMRREESRKEWDSFARTTRRT